MVLLRWMHVRKLVPLAELMEQLGSGRAPTSDRPAAPSSKLPPASSRPAPTSDRPAPTSSRPAPTSDTLAPTSDKLAPTGERVSPSTLKDAFLAEIRAGKSSLYNIVVAQAQRIEVADDRITFTFLPAHRTLREQFDQNRPWLEAAAERLAGRRIPVVSVQADAPVQPTTAARGDAPRPEGDAAKRDLKAEAMSSSAVQAMLDVFPAEIRDVEEM
jgi:hypothetical protein